VQIKWLKKESARYALLLVVLLATAAVAVVGTLGYISDLVPQHEQLVIASIIWALTMGFMLIAGAFGLWAIHFAAESESLRRLGRMVDDMDYIRDGVVALDRQGRITGLNPAAVDILGEIARGRPLTELDAPVSEKQLQMLLHTESPVEIETLCSRNGESRMLRIRSQPSKGILTLLIGDVTALVRQREQTRRTAFLQLVGHMAKGVANDFNDLLCGIAGHAGLLTHQGNAKADVPASARAIQDCANRGILLARQLMQLAAEESGEIAATACAARHIDNGIALLRGALPPDWTIDCTIDPGINPVNMPPIQVEHLVQSLGLAAADNAAGSHFLAISLAKPDKETCQRLSAPVAAVLTITSTPSAEAKRKPVAQELAANGVIFSVISALLQQAGGLLERYTDDENHSFYQVLLPEADPATLTVESSEALILGLAAYAANWHILIDEDISGADDCIRYLDQAGIHTLHASGIAHLLGAIENAEQLDAMALSADVLGDDQRSLLKAITKLSPKTGIVIQQPPDSAPHPTPGIVCVPTPVMPNQLLHAMIEARSRIRATSR
jgi:PAS domain-containing protein